MIFFLNICFHILFEFRNILVGAHKYFYCLNNNFAIYANIKMRYNENREIRGGMILHRLKRQTAKIKIVWFINNNQDLLKFNIK
jgi:hypothetical protein